VTFTERAMLLAGCYGALVVPTTDASIEAAEKLVREGMLYKASEAGYRITNEGAKAIT
jgi:predicted transcriptional regulator